ncbi:MAG: glucose 1-dehydrogenase [Gemmatimonadetes bacterium]|nr:glucose 1-dehydrogenase [Gemmatimonadota bacterium]
MAAEFAGKVALITGGATGIGRAAALQLAAQGALVVIADVALEAARQTAADCVSAGGKALPVACNVRDDGQVASAVAAAVDTYGQLDIAINAAGIGGREVRTADYDPADWDAVIDINLTGVWRSMRHEIPAMLRKQSGCIVNVASVAGLNGFPRHPAYAASKHGVIGLTKTAALEYGRKGLRINALCPGFTLTPMVQQMLDAGLPKDDLAARVPLGRLGTPEEVAASALYLCSSAAAFMIGHSLAVDGGIVAG